MTFLRAIATPFKPMSITHNIAKKAVTWHPRGITEVRRFTIESCESLPKRELVGPPKSTIKDADPEASNPFKIPDEGDEVLTIWDWTNGENIIDQNDFEISPISDEIKSIFAERISQLLISVLGYDPNNGST